MSYRRNDVLVSSVSGLAIAGLAPVVNPLVAYEHVAKFIHAQMIVNHDSWPYCYVVEVDWATYRALVAYHHEERVFFLRCRWASEFGTRWGMTVENVHVYPATRQPSSCALVNMKANFGPWTTDEERQ